LGQMPFAVVWVKRASEIVVGLAMPPDLVETGLSGPPPGCKYAGLSGYFKITATDEVPNDLGNWASIAYDHAKLQCNG
jgi:hypothetical protein